MWYWVYKWKDALLKKKPFIWYENENTCHSKYCPSLATTFPHNSGNLWIPSQKNFSSLEAKNEVSQFLIPSAWIEISGSRKEQGPGYKAGEVKLPIHCLPNSSGPNIQYVAERCHVEKLWTRVCSHILAVFSSIPASNVSIVFGKEVLWLFDHLEATSSTPLPSGPTK